MERSTSPNADVREARRHPDARSYAQYVLGRDFPDLNDDDKRHLLDEHRALWQLASVLDPQAYPPRSACPDRHLEALLDRIEDDAIQCVPAAARRDAVAQAYGIPSAIAQRYLDGRERVSWERDQRLIAIEQELSVGGPGALTAVLQRHLDECRSCAARYRTAVGRRVRDVRDLIYRYGPAATAANPQYARELERRIDSSLLGAL